MEGTKVCSCCNTKKTLSEFNKNGFGYKSVCRECENKHRAEKREERNRIKQQAVDALNAHNMRLSDFTPRELMEELKRRGYEGKLRYVRVEEIDLSNF